MIDNRFVRSLGIVKGGAQTIPAFEVHIEPGILAKQKAGDGALQAANRALLGNSELVQLGYKISINHRGIPFFWFR
jgi:hypothetical protein